MRRKVAAIALSVTAALPVVGASSPTAHAAPDDIVAVVVEGTGSGHGRGLSQWGAYGWAVDQGKSWGWILDHYYGGTVAGAVGATERVRVRLIADDGSPTVAVTSRGPGVTWNGTTAASMYAEEVSADRFDIYSSAAITCPGAVTLTVPDGPLSYDPSKYRADVERMQRFLDVHHDSAIGVDGYFGPQTQAILTNWQIAQSLHADGVWDLDDATRARAIIAAAGGGGGWTRIGVSAPGPITFASPNGDTSSAKPGDVIGLCDPDGSITHYRGEIEFWSTSSGNRVVNDVKVEDYLRGVVPKEIAASWADAGGGKGVNAVRAQAVAARSFGLQQNRYSYAATCDTTSCQVYAGAARRNSVNASATPVEDPRSDAAIAATAGVVRRWPAGHPLAGQIVSTEFSASNGPRTAGGAFPVVDDAAGDATSKNPYHRWTRVLDADTLAARYGLGRLTGATMVEAASPVYQQFDGIWFNDVVLTGTNGTFRQQAWDFRNGQGLRSPGFTVRVIRRDTTPLSVGLIGDSVGASVAGGGGELDTLIEGAFRSQTIDVVAGRCTTNIFCPGTSGVEAANALPAGLDLVVVQLGYNDWSQGFPDDIDHMMAALAARGARQVVWVNLADIKQASGGGSLYGPSNQALQAATARWPNLAILDWNAASNHAERPRWFTDGVHLTTTGRAEFALWLRARLVDPGVVGSSHWLAPPKKIVLPVTGVPLTTPGGAAVSVPADARAVALNITGVGPVGSGFATVWPCASPRPDTSNLNFVAGDVVANSVIAPVGPDGTVCFYSSVGTDLLVDIAGWFPAGGSTPTFVQMTPHRAVDTRHGIGAPAGPVARNSPLRVRLGGATMPQPGGGSVTIPADAAAVAINLTAVGSTAAGFATVWPCSSPRPVASHLNYATGDTVPNTVIAPLDSSGELCVYLDAPAHVLVDVAGWFPAGQGGAGFRATIPGRVVDTRQGAKVSPSSPLAVPIHGRTLATAGGPQAVPASATAVAINLTIVDASAAGYATVWPCGAERPEASNANFLAGDVVANGVVAPLGPGGSICVHTSTAAHVLVDVMGWFSGGAQPAFVGAVPDRLVDTRNGIGPRPS